MGTSRRLCGWVGGIFLWSGCYEGKFSLGDFQCRRAGECSDVELSVKLDGIAPGSVTGAGLDCVKGSVESVECSALFPYGEARGLTAVPDVGASLARWDGCAASNGGALECSVLLEMRSVVTASFGYELAIELDGAMSGDAVTISRMSELIKSCRGGEPCTPSIFTDGATITIEASSPGARWVGCAASGSRCDISMTERRRVIVLFGDSRCSDGRVDQELGETCDDGAMNDGDGCSSSCLVEEGFGCFGSPSSCKGFVLSRTQLTTAENGAASTFTVALTEAPENTVTLAVRSNDETEGVVTPASLTFTNTSFGPQTVTVTPVDDDVPDGPAPYAIVLGPPSGDAFFSALTVPNVAVTNTDDEPVLELSVLDSAGVERDENLRFRFVLSSTSTHDVVVEYTLGGSATEGADYEAVSGELTILANTMAAVLDVRLFDDTRDEDVETVELTVTSIDNATLRDGYAIGMIADDDAPPVLNIAGPITAPEGDVGSSAAELVISLSEPSGFEITVNYATRDGSATADDFDYVAELSSVTFAADMDPPVWRVPITINGDTRSEIDEEFFVDLSLPVLPEPRATIGTVTASVTIEDEDPNPFFIISDVNVDEGDTATFTVSLNAPSGREVRVDWAAANNTAVAADYTAGSGTLIFPSGTTQQMVSINTTEDTTDEPFEGFFVNLTGAVNADVVDGQGLGTIVDDDPQPCLAITALTPINETNTAFNVTVSVTLSAVSGHVVTVDYATANATAIAGADYTAASGVLTFNPGSTSATFDVSISGDTLDENDETFTIGLSNEQHATFCVSNSATATIVDNDPRPTLSINSVSAPEGTATNTTQTFTVTLSAASGLLVTVDWATMPASASSVPPADFVAGTGMLMFMPGIVTQTIDITVLADGVNEGLETYTVVLSGVNLNATIAAGTGTGTIQNDDGPPALTIADVSMAEANTTLVFTVLLSAPSQQTITVSWATSNGTAQTAAPADYMGASGSLTFIANDTSETFSVSILEDALDEDNETITVTLSNEVNAILGDGVAIGMIIDDDALPTLSITGVTITEGDVGTTNAAFTVTLTPVSGRTVTVNYETIEGTATAPEDFTALGPAVLTFNAGQASQTITVAVVGEASYEFDETFSVLLSAPSNTNLSATPSATGTITNNDSPPSLSIASVSVTEGNAGTVDAVFNVTLFPASGRSASVSYATAPGTAVAADFVAASGGLTFNAGVTIQPITVQVNGDTLDEDVESFTVTLSTPVNATIVSGTGTGTINDNDAPPSITITDVTVTEGNAGTTTAIFNINLSAASGRIVEVDYVTANGTTNPATAGSDYTALSLATATFSPGTTTFPVSVTVTGDTRDELNETFFVNLSNANNGMLTDSQGVGTITDDDVPPSVTIDSVFATEPGAPSSATFTVTLSAASNLPISVAYATISGTAGSGSDFFNASGTLNFAAGTTSMPLNVSILTDALDEDDETFTLILSSPTNATLGTPSSGTATIIDNDSPPSISFMDDAITILEPMSGTQAGLLTVVLSAPSGRSVSVDWATANDTAVAPGDYVSASGTLTFVAGTTSQTITLTVNSDAVANEPNQDFFVNLSSASNASIADLQAVITIDAPGPLARGEPRDRAESLLRLDEGANAESRAAAVSRDGEIIAFESDATNLVEDDTNEATDIFVYDSATRTLERISTHDTGTSRAPAISADGRYVVFESTAGVLVYDRLIRATLQTIEGATHANISADGRYLIYRKATELFVHDRATQTTTPTSDTNKYTAAAISERGRFVLLLSNDHLLLQDRELSRTALREERAVIATMTPDARSLAWIAPDRTIFFSDRIDGAAEPLGHTGDGVSISDDGRYLAFTDDARLFVIDQKTKTQTALADRASSPRLSGDGRQIVFLKDGALYKMGELH